MEKMIKDIHANAVEKGFWSTEEQVTRKMEHYSDTFSTSEVQAVRDAFTSQRIVLIVTELAEAIQELRKGNDGNFKEEIADAVIRCFDLCGGMEIDLKEQMETKMAINLLRPRMHSRNF